MIFLLLFSLGCKSDEESKKPIFDPYDVPVGPYETNITWTDYGIPHITGQDYGSLGYGMGYALAKDHYCVLIDQIVRVRGERSKFHGEDHVDADFGWKAFGLLEMAEENFRYLDSDIQDMLIGYAAGYNRYHREYSDTIPTECRNKAWVRDITHIDLLTYYLGLGLKASGENFVREVGSAQPPSRLNQPPLLHMQHEAIQNSPRSLEDVLDPIKNPHMGSNGWAIGSENTHSGSGGLLLSNTHFPYWGERRWHESHLTIPGKLDVYGASLIGVAAINIGFNQHVAWTHTVSINPRFVVYTLELEEGEPTSYLYNGEYIAMDEYNFSVEVLQSDGSIQNVDRTLYKSRYGWMLNAPQFGWPDTVGFTFRDANEGNLDMLATWFDMNRSSNLDEFIDAQKTHKGIPWVYSLATDASGEVWFADTAATPNFTAEAEEYYLETEVSQNPFARIFREYGVIAVSGSTDRFDWEAQDGARTPGLIPFDESPQQRRKDYVFNANNSHWLSNVSEPLEGYSFLFGEERTPRSPRTRMNAKMLEEEEEWTLDKIKQSALSGRAILAEDLLSSVVERCTGIETITVEFEEEDHTVNIQEACMVLSNWDGLSKGGSIGVHVWRETIGAEIFEYEDLTDARLLYAESFDPENPVSTPSTLAEPTGENDYLLQSLGIAVLRLEQAGISLQAPLEEIQYQVKDGDFIPVMGHAEWEGGISIAEYSGGNATLIPKETRGEVLNPTTNLTEDGYHINYGNSWIAAIEITENGPICEAIMTYSQSADSTSEHFRDQSDLYATEEFRPCFFTTDEIKEHMILEVELELD